MDCPSCGRANPSDARFCNGCAQALATVCTSCHQENPPEARFCNGCGVTLAESPAPLAVPDRLPYTPKHLVEKILQSKSALEGEHKQVTVLFADVKDSTRLAEQAGPEQWHAILDGFLGILAEGVHRFEGTVNQYTGDGIMALFGAPISHEDHAQRACHAALVMRDELRNFSQELRRTHGLDFVTRIGLNSGNVVVGKIGDDLRMDYTAQGQCVHLAARMEALAEAGRVYLAPATVSLVRGYLEVEDLGEFNVKGAAEPLRVHELVGIGQAQSRLDVARSRGLSQFVGRVHEMESLQAALAQAREGHGQVVAVVGDAGVGKSRLCSEFLEHARAGGTPVYRSQCAPHGRTASLSPVRDLLRDLFGISSRDATHEIRSKIARELRLLDDSFDDVLPLVFDLLGVSDKERPDLPLEVEVRQRQLFGFARKLVQAHSAREPSVLFIDDVHWIDSASDAYLAQIVEAVGDSRTLLLVNFRPDYHAAWMGKSGYQQLPLRVFSSEEVTAQLQGLLGADPSIAALPDLIRDRTAGNPFFVEEVVRSLAESGSLEGEPGAYRLVQPIRALEVPTTVQPVLAARIDRLSERDKRLLQTASVLGKRFQRPLLECVADLSNPDLAAALSCLQESEFLQEIALYPVVEYAFKHPLTQQVAYDSLLSERRKQVHAAVAQALEEQFPERVAAEPEVVARHCDEAGLGGRAIAHYERAGQRATERGVSAEAVEHLERGIDLLRGMQEGRERDRQELNLQLDLGAASFSAIGGRASGHAFERALALSGEVGDASDKFQALTGLSNFSRNNNAARAVELGRELLDLAEEIGGTPHLLLAHSALGNPLLFQGELSKALEHHDRAVELYDSSQHQSLAYVHGVDPGISSLAQGSLALWLLGHPDRALRRCERGVELTENGTNLFSRAYLQVQLASVALRRGEPQRAIAAAEYAIAICTEWGYQEYASFGFGLRTVARCQLGQVEAARELNDGPATYRAVSGKGWPPMLPMSVGQVADAQRRVGRLEDALGSVDAALALSAEGRVPFWDGELFRLKGDIRLEQEPGAEAEAEQLFQRALNVARTQAAKSLELRAATSLARLRRQQRRNDDARAVLAPVYQWFTEGFDTQDLKNAKTLLDDLA